MTVEEYKAICDSITDEDRRRLEEQRIIAKKCGNCKYFCLKTTRYDLFRLNEKMVCVHPKLFISDPFEEAFVEMNENDYCTRFEEVEI